MNTDPVSQLEEAVRAEVAAARIVRQTLATHNDRIIQLLMDIRRIDPGYPLADLEGLVGCYFERATISRRTAHALKDPKSRGRSRVAA